MSNPICSLVHQLGEIALPMESECVDCHQVRSVSVIVPSTLLLVTHILKCVDKFLGINLDIQMASTLTSLALMACMLME